MMARLISRLDQVVIALPRTVFMVNIAPRENPSPTKRESLLGLLSRVAEKNVTRVCSLKIDAMEAL